MRSSPTLSETRFSLSFFLTTPAKKPRTECCCQSVAFMIAAIVVPFGCRSIPSTASCFDEPLVDLAETFLGVLTLDEPVAFDTAVRGAFAEGRAGCDRLVTLFAVFDLDLLVAIWLSLMSSTASCAATDISPRNTSTQAQGLARGSGIRVSVNRPGSLHFRFPHTRSLPAGSPAEKPLFAGVLALFRPSSRGVAGISGLSFQEPLNFTRRF